MTREEKIHEILALKGIPQSQWAAKSKLFAAFPDVDIHDTLVDERRKAGKVVAQQAKAQVQQQAAKQARPQESWSDWLARQMGGESAKQQAKQQAAKQQAAKQQASRQQYGAKEQAFGGGTSMADWLSWATGEEKKSRKSAKKSRKSKKVSKALQKRVSRISRAIKSGRVLAKRNIKVPSDFKDKRLSRKERAEKYVQLYKGARVKGCPTLPAQRRSARKSRR